MTVEEQNKKTLATPSMKKWTGFCITCKFFGQGGTCSFCENPKQTEASYKTYLYYDYKCELWEFGTAQSRIDYMNKLEKNAG